MQGREGDGEYEHFFRLANREDGAWSINQGDAFIFFKYPASAGDVYLVEIGLIDTMTVVSVDDFVQSPAGEFTCYHYRLVPEDKEDLKKIDFWLSEGVGFVRMESFGWTSMRSWTVDSLVLN